MTKFHICVINKDQDVMSALHSFMIGKKWENGGAIVSGLGSVYDVTLGNPGNKEWSFIHEFTIPEPCEVVSFVGEITPKEKASQSLPKAIFDAATSDYIIHVHMSCSHGESAQTNGGSMRKVKVLRALTVFIIEND